MDNPQSSHALHQDSKEPPTKKTEENSNNAPIKKPPRLGSSGIIALQKHFLSLEKLKAFSNALMVNKTFLNHSHNYKTAYEIYIQPFNDEKVIFSFRKPTEFYVQYDDAKMTFECAHRLLNLLKPHFVRFDVDTSSSDEYSALIQAFDGKIGFFVSWNASLIYVNRFWQRLDRLECRINVLKNINTARETPFDRSIISNIENEEDLNAALRFPANQLHLKFSSEFDNTDNVQLLESDANQVTLELCETNSNKLPLVVQKFCNACKKMKKLEICYQNREGAADFNSLSSKLLEHHRSFTEAIKTARQILPNLKLIVNSEAWYEPDESEFNVPQNWKDHLKQMLGNIEIEETSQDDGLIKVVISSKIKDRLTDVAHRFEFDYDPNDNDEESESDSDEENEFDAEEQNEFGFGFGLEEEIESDPEEQNESDPEEV